MASSVLRISASTPSIHVSTAPSATQGSLNSKDSPSAEVMPRTVLFPRPNVSEAQLSYSFSMCSCTDVGSDVPSTASSSSSEMKKKRGNAFRFESRYSLSDFWHRSRFSAISCRFASRFFAEQHSRMLTFLAVSFMISAQLLSILSKRFASSGSWSRMSSLPMKMLSRYIHLRCTAIHTSSTSPIRLSLPSHSSTSAVKGFTKRLAIIDCSVRFMSSKIIVVSSVLRRMNPRSTSPLLTYRASVNFCSRQTSANLAMSPSIFSSFSAAMHISSTGSWCLCVSIASNEPSVSVAGSKSTSGCAVMRMSCCQCLGRSASDFSASNRGSASAKAAKFSSRSSKTGFLHRLASSRIASNFSSKRLATACSFLRSRSDHSAASCLWMASSCAEYTA